MSKRLFLIMLLIMLPFSFVYAGDDEEEEDSGAADIESSLLDKSDREQDSAQQGQDSTNAELKDYKSRLSGAGIAVWPAKAVISLYEQVTTYIRGLLRFKSFSDSTDSSAKRVSAVFRSMIVMFYILSLAYFVFQKVSGKNISVHEVFNISLKVIICLIIFSQMYYIPDLVVKGAQRIAMFIFGYKNDFNMAMAALVSDGAVGSLMALGAVLSVGGGVLFLGPCGIGLQVSIIKDLGFSLLATAVFAIIGAGVCVWLYALTCLNLYLATIIMVLYLPATLFTNFWGYDNKTTFKFFFTNFIQVFLITFEILVIKHYLLRETGVFREPASGVLGFLVPEILPTLGIAMITISSRVINSFVQGTVADIGTIAKKSGRYSSKANGDMLNDTLGGKVFLGEKKNDDKNDEANKNK